MSMPYMRCWCADECVCGAAEANDRIQEARQRAAEENQRAMDERVERENKWESFWDIYLDGRRNKYADARRTEVQE